MTRLRIGLVLLALLAPGAAHAQYPVKPIRMIVTYPPGGSADTMARLIAPKLTESLGQTIVVENRPGASGTIAADAVANSAPDGYTLMLDASSYAVNPSLYAKLAYDPTKAFTPVTLIAVFPNMLVVHPAFGVASVKELVELPNSRHVLTYDIEADDVCRRIVVFFERHASLE
jgi:tripartite-type tricarboxylate transporter receptor subunit TctC